MDNQYQDLTQLEQLFIQGKMTHFPEQLSVQGVVYNFRQHREDVSWKDIVTNRTNKALTIYSLAPNAENRKRMEDNRNVDNRLVPDEILAFGWSITTQMRVIPIGLAFTTRNRSSGNNRMFESTEITYQEPVTIDGLNNNEPITAKIDTGADVCSLHATNIKINGDSVTFDINGRVYTMNLHRTQTIKQADSDAEPRPVVLLNFSIAGQNIPNIECNLNDRSGMSSPLLIGRNLLGKHDFNIKTIDSAESYMETFSSEDWSFFDQLFEGCTIEEHQTIDIDKEKENLSTQDLVQQLLKKDISFTDIIEEAYKIGIHKGSLVSY